MREKRTAAVQPHQGFWPEKGLRLSGIGFGFGWAGCAGREAWGIGAEPGVMRALCEVSKVCCVAAPVESRTPVNGECTGHSSIGSVPGM